MIGIYWPTIVANLFAIAVPFYFLLNRIVMRQQQRKLKSGNGKTTVIPGHGDPCPRCGVPMEIREHNGVGDKQRAGRTITRDGSAA